MIKFRLLEANEIEVKIKQVGANGAVALIYKTARVDMDILDETVGAENWETDYKEIKGNLYCGIGVRTSEEKPFVWKWDCGIESRSDDDGNEKKGEASDAFKRAGFKWGIGRELYTSPFIFINLPTELDGRKYKLKNPYEKFNVSEIAYDEQGRIAKLVILNDKKEAVYQYPKSSQTPPQIQSTGKPSTNAQSGENTTKKPIFKCTECDCEITKTVKEWSEARFNRALCRDCQKIESVPQKKKRTIDEQNDDIPF